ncbi:MAG: hypothetical protein ACI4U2_07000 [Christensenellaceae bacterium]
MKQRLKQSLRLCLTFGLVFHICALTGCTAKEQHVHGGEWEIVIEPTCLEEGLRQKICPEDGYRIEETIPALGHDVVIDESVEATCTSPGKTEGSHCARCHMIFVRQETVILGHRSVEDPFVAPTCTEVGYTAGKHCPDCGLVLLAQSEIPALGHTFSTQWSWNESAHWHEAVCGHEVVSSYEEHSYQDGVCTVCGSIEIARYRIRLTANDETTDLSGVKVEWFSETTSFVAYTDAFGIADAYLPVRESYRILLADGTGGYDTFFIPAFPRNSETTISLPYLPA